MKLNNNILYTNEDNMLLMAKFPDDYFDLAIVDPEYGIKESSKNHNSRNTPVKQKNGSYIKPKDKNYKQKFWDNETPKENYFIELQRVSKKQIIWGGNYFTHLIPQKSSGRIIWDKCNGDNDFSDCEIAWTNLFQSTRLVRYMWNGMMQGKSITEGHIQQGNKRLNEKRIHQTQKPVIIYKWLLTKFGKEGYKIFDTHVGSGSIIIACDDLGYNFTGCEIDKEHYIDSLNRIKNHLNQVKLIF